MASIFNQTDKESLLIRFNKLSADSPRQWGKMSPAQMLKHCEGPIDVALGTMDVKVNFFIRLIGPYIKRSMLSGKPFKKNSPTAPGYIVIDSPDFERERAILIDKINTLSAIDPATFEGKRHPIFGTMLSAEWGQLSHDHLDHHLRQFGV